MKNTIILKSIALVAAVCISFTVQAQYAYFPQEGTITYEKTIYLKNKMKRMISMMKPGDWQRQYAEQMITRVGENAVLKKQLFFSGSEISYSPIKEDYDPTMANLQNSGMLDYQGSFYQDLAQGSSKLAFEFGGSNIVVEDSVLSVKWKITNEYRNIAGFECRRANGVLLDSIYVVAFYTDQIPLTAGPGAVNGLPGMILGLVVPEQHFHIYATAVNFSAPTLARQVGKKNAKPLNRAELKSTLKEKMGNFFEDNLFNMMVSGMLIGH